MTRSALVGFALLAGGCAGSDGSTVGKPDASGSSDAEAGARDAARPIRDASETEVPLVDAKSDGATISKPSVSVLTQHNDAARSGANLLETELTVASVGGASFGKVFARAVDDQVYAQPLVVSGLDVPQHGRKNVLFVATVNDSIYAFDADDPSATAPFWTKSFLGPGIVPPRNTDMTGACNGHYTDFSGNIGIVSTPVIDPASGTLYAVARTHENGSFFERIHAISILDGSERPGSPATISATVPGTGEGTASITFDPLRENQRAGLLLSNGIVYVGFAAHCDWGPYHGWMFGYDAATLEQKIVYNTTPNGNAGGFWQSGQGPASDGTDLFVITGNGTVGDKTDPRSPIGRGESFLKLRPNAGTLKVESFFTPYDYRTLEAGDLDLGAGGMLLVPGTRLGVGGGKAGVLYVVDVDDMGGLTTSTTVNDNVIQTFPVSAPNRIAGSPVFWAGPDGGRVYVWGESDQLKAFPFLGAAYSPGGTVLDVAHTVKSAVTNVPAMPGAMLSISANGSAHGTGIVWALHSQSGSANQEVRPGLFRAFDAETLTEIWNNQKNAPRDGCGNFAKYSFSTIANGKVYLPSFSNQVCVYGLGAQDD